MYKTKKPPKKRKKKRPTVFLQNCSKSGRWVPLKWDGLLEARGQCLPLLYNTDICIAVLLITGVTKCDWAFLLKARRTCLCMEAWQKEPLCGCGRAREGIWRSSWKISSSILNKWEGQEVQNHMVLTAGYQDASTSKEGRSCCLPSLCVKVPVSLRHKPTSVPTVLWGMVWPAQGKGCALSERGDWFERKMSNKKKRKKIPKSRILPKKIAFLLGSNSWESVRKPQQALSVALRQNSLLGKMSALFLLPCSHKLCPAPGRWERVVLFSLFRGRKCTTASFAIIAAPRQVLQFWLWVLARFGWDATAFWDIPACS